MQTDHPDFVYLPFAAGGRVYNPESRQAYAIEPGSCSCKQYKISGQTCKHLLELYRRLVAGEATWPLQDPAYLPEAGTEPLGPRRTRGQRKHGTAYTMAQERRLRASQG